MITLRFSTLYNISTVQFAVIKNTLNYDGYLELVIIITKLELLEMFITKPKIK